MKAKLKRLSKQNEVYIFLIIVALSFLIQMRSGQFYTANNFLNLSSALIVPGLFAMAVFLIILSGGIDVSFPALASLSAYFITNQLLIMDYQGGIWFPIVLAIVIGGALGSVNGFFVSYLNMPAMIVTLGTASVFRGVMQGPMASRQLAVIPQGMQDFGTSSFFTVTNQLTGHQARLPITFAVLVVVAILVFFLLKYTMLGRGIYAIGGNEIAAYNAGFHVKRTKFLLFVSAGAIASVAGIVRTSMMRQMHPTNMLGMEMNIIAGVVLGGVAITGGKGTLTGCILGTLLIVIVENSLILIGIPVVWRSVFIGLLIVIGTSISAFQSRK